MIGLLSEHGSPGFRVLDIGASGGLVDLLGSVRDCRSRMRILMAYPGLYVEGIEPGDRSGLGDPPYARVHDALLAADEREVEFHDTGDAGCRSIFKPDSEATGDFDRRAIWAVKGADTRRTTTLDTLLAGQAPYHCIGLDVQGAEAEIMRGGGAYFGSCMLLAVEVAFRPLYEGACSFAEVDALARSHGMALVRLDDHPFAFGELVEGEAYYLADPATLSETDDLLRYLLCCWLVGAKRWALRTLDTIGSACTDAGTRARLRAEVDTWNDAGTMVNRLALETRPDPIVVDRALWHAVAERCRAEGWKKVALYGAGQTARDLLGAGWPGETGPAVVAVFDDDPKADAISGVPVVRPTDAPGGLDAVILASHAHEPVIATAAERSFPSLPVVRVYTENKPA